jgi:hypothetical protein
MENLLRFDTAMVNVNKTTKDRYKALDSQAILDLIEDKTNMLNLVSDVKFIKLGKRVTRTKHTIQIDIDKNLKVMDDDVTPRIYVTNSYNGESSLIVHAGMMRLVCSNGLIVGESLFKEKVRHIVGETFDYKIAALGDKIERAIAYMIENTSQIESYVSIDITPEKQLNIVKRLGLSKRLTDRILYTMEHRDMLRFEDRGMNLWATYNIINETMKQSSRSEMGFFNNNVKLMDRVRNLTLDSTLTYNKAS